MLLGLIVAISLSVACGSDDKDDDFDTVDVVDNSDVDDVDEAPGVELPEGVAVPIDLVEHLADAPDAAAGSMKVFQLQEGDAVPTSEVAEARAGDWVLENDRVKIYVEGVKRAMSPCPYGGNIIDAQVKGPDGTLSEDNVGEICLMVNVGQTFAPERFDVVLDGANGGPVVLAISGTLQLLDFIDIKTMADSFAPGLINQVAIDPDDIMPNKVTRYLILMPGQTHVRVLEALHNTGDTARHLVTGHLMRGGGHGNYFNPISRLNGWGYTSLGLGNLSGDPLPFVAFAGPSGGYAYVPKPDANLLPAAGDFPRGGTQAAVAGVSLSMLGLDDVAATLLAKSEQLAVMPGLLHLEPDEVGVVEHREYFGGGALSSITDSIYPYLVEETGTLQGKVSAGDGAGVAGAKVTAVNSKGQAMSQAITDEEGRYQMVLPADDYQVRARFEARVSVADASATVGADASAEADVVLKDGATIRVAIQTPDGAPTPGRVSLFCEGPCNDVPTSLEADITFDPLPVGFAQVRWTDVQGKVDLNVAAGTYRVSVSRGMEWSVWPASAPDDGGFLVEIADGELKELTPEIAHVVDTTGVVNGDFHVHGITSADSVVRPDNRVLGFMGDGVDVLVSTDHDYIFDYAPTVAALGAQDEIVSMVGVEITTPNIGHFNSFPLIRDPAHSRGGALDWGPGIGSYNLSPAEMFDWMDEQGGGAEHRVKQINHPDWTIPSLRADLLRGFTYASAESRRMEPSEPDPVTGDTGLWSDNFNAFEVMNGPTMSKLWTVMRWWLTMISRGFTPTGTAVSDTHMLYSDLGGSPRTFVFVDPAHDTPATFDEAHFAQAIIEGRAIGSNGPFFRVVLENSEGVRASLGDTIESGDGELTAYVSVDVPEWMPVDTIDIYSNLPAEDIITAPGQEKSSPIPPTSSHPIEFEASDLVEVASGDVSHKHWVKTVEIPLSITEDAYVIVVVRAQDPQASMWPVIPQAELKPFAFSNPIFVDADGNGYDNPPLAELAETTSPWQPTIYTPQDFRGLTLTPEQQLGNLFEGWNHDH